MREVSLFCSWILFITGIGLSVTAILMRSKEYSLSDRLSVSFGFGLGAVSLQMGILSFFGVPFTRSNLIMWSWPVVVPGVIMCRAGKGSCRKDPLESSGTTRFSFFEKFFIAGIGFEIFYAFFRALIRPMESYDSVAIYALKAKIFFLSRSIPTGLLRDPLAIVPHADYPLLVPLSETSLYVFLGSLNDHLVKIIFPLFFVSLVVFVYLMVRRVVPRKESLLFTFLLASIPQVSAYATNGYADLPFAFYYSLALFFLWRWMDGTRADSLALSFFSLLLAAWTKNEGQMLALIALFVSLWYLVRERKALRGRETVSCAMYCVAALLLLLFAFVFPRSLGLVNDTVNAATLRPVAFVTQLTRLPDILYEYQIQFFGPKKWNIIWILCITGIIAGRARVFSGPLQYVSLSILFALAGYTAVYLITPQGLSWHLSTSASRLFIHFVPAAVYWLACLCHDAGMDL